MGLRVVEFVQRSENGGNPIDNETARMVGIGHGTSVMVIPTRDLVGLLKLAATSPHLEGRAGESARLAEAIADIDRFVMPVTIGETLDLLVNGAG